MIKVLLIPLVAIALCAVTYWIVVTGKRLLYRFSPRGKLEAELKNNLAAQRSLQNLITPDNPDSIELTVYQAYLDNLKLKEVIIRAKLRDVELEGITS